MFPIAVAVTFQNQDVDPKSGEFLEETLMFWGDEGTNFLKKSDVKSTSIPAGAREARGK